jgi:hypothetical protein
VNSGATVAGPPGPSQTGNSSSGVTSGSVHNSWFPGVQITFANRLASEASTNPTSANTSPTSPATISQSPGSPGDSASA